MATEECAACGAVVPFADTVHLLVHTKSEEGVVDHYICQECYEDEIEPVVES